MRNELLAASVAAQTFFTPHVFGPFGAKRQDCVVQVVETAIPKRAAVAI
jgi:hypothetical protein